VVSRAVIKESYLVIGGFRTVAMGATISGVEEI
jgi:hypothetical protein